jgi:putative NADH-flavin reductase
MNILVFGASGRVGRRLCEYAHGDGHAVTAFVRDAVDAPADVATAVGDVSDVGTVSAAVSGVDAVCSALGPDDAEDTSVLVDGTDNIVTAMQSHGVDRLVAVAAAGILQATPSRLRLDMVEFPHRLRRLAAAHCEVYGRLRDSSLDWTLACPPEMPDGSPTNHYRTAVDYLPEGGQSISTGDVARFVYDAVTANRHVGERVGLAY